MSNAKKAEEILERYLKWRVTKPGNRKVEFLAFYGSGSDEMLRVKSTRPATPQEQELWDHAIGLQEQLLDMTEGMDAYEARDSLGRKREP